MNACTMGRRGFLRAAGLGAAGLAMAGRANPGEAPAERPNIILIMADDLGYGDLSCYGSRAIATPNLDALARGGVRFTDFHSNGAVCTPTRAALLTGRYQQRCGLEGVLLALEDREKAGLSLDSTTFAECLKTRGYATGLFGKWHLGYPEAWNPVHQGFDEFRGFVSGNIDYHSHVDRVGYADWWDGVKKAPEEGYTTHLITRHALDFIERHKDKPFCLYLPHEASHSPLQGPDDPAFREVGKRDQGKHTQREAVRAYREMVEEMDRGVGQLVAKLEHLALTDSTFIFFCSDNGAKLYARKHALGGCSSNRPLRGGKGKLWEGGHRVPAIACWPGTIPAGCVTGQTAMTMDLFPTLAAIAGAKIPTELKLDGVNLLPMLTRNEKLPARTLFWRRSQSDKAVRRGPWKLRVTDTDMTLHNLDTDLAEQYSLASAKPGVAKELLAELAAWEANVDQ